MDTALLTVNEASRFLGIGRSFLYSKLLSTGEIPTVRLGRAVRVPKSCLEDYVARLTAASGKAAPRVVPETECVSGSIPAQEPAAP